MQHQQHKFTGFGGLQLFYQCWRPEKPVRAILVVVHGLSEHSGRYMNLVNRMVAKGIVVYAFDQRGHGRSAEKRLAHVDNWSEYRKDLAAFVDLIVAREKNTPLFLMGHSMGGLVVTNYVLHDPTHLSGVILSAPPLGDIGVSWLIRFFGSWIAKIFPKTVFKSGLDLSGISRDAEVLREYDNDPLIDGKISAQWGVEFLEAIEWTQAHAGSFAPPVLIFHGDADRLVPISASRSFFDKIKQTDKKYITYKGGYHESLGDLQREQVLDAIESWLIPRIQVGV